jgi:hypothetical protein
MNTQPDPGQEDLEILLLDLKSIGMPILEGMEFGLVKFDIYKTIISREIFEFYAVDNPESILDAINTKEFGVKISSVMSEEGKKVIRSRTKKWANIDRHFFNLVENDPDVYYILKYFKSKSRVICSREIKKNYINSRGFFFTENDLGLIDLI